MKTKIIVFMISLMMVFLMAGCNLGKKIERSITEGVLEKIGEEENLDIDFDEDGFTYSTDEGEVTFGEDGYVYEGNDGEIVAVGSKEWPTGMAADLIPKLEAGVVDTTMNSDKNCLVILSDISQEEYMSYKEKVIDAGYTKDSYELKGGDGEYYGAYKDNASIYLYYYYVDKALSISIGVEEEQGE